MRKFTADTSGATAIEYTMCAALIAFVVITALTTMGTKVNTMLGQVIPGLK